MSDYSAIDISTLPQPVQVKLALLADIQQRRRDSAIKWIKKNPEKHRQLSKNYYYRNQKAVQERSKALYHRKKAANQQSSPSEDQEPLAV
jgi:hypothetical protein